jgi:hypothetical protein
MDKVKILFLAADPSDAARLRLGQELRDIRAKLQCAKQRDNFSLESRESVRPGDITQAIFDVEPQIVHFSGHGISTGELLFEDILGSTHPVKPDALANLFQLVSEQVNCVVLNACYSEAQAKSIAQHIPFVIGMNQSISDKAAIAFAVGFYGALGSGRSFEDAYKFACVEIQLGGTPGHLIPALYARKDKNIDVALEDLQIPPQAISNYSTIPQDKIEPSAEQILETLPLINLSDKATTDVFKNLSSLDCGSSTTEQKPETPQLLTGQQSLPPPVRPPYQREEIRPDGRMSSSQIDKPSSSSPQGESLGLHLMILMLSYGFYGMLLGIGSNPLWAWSSVLAGDIAAACSVVVADEKTVANAGGMLGAVAGGIAGGVIGAGVGIFTGSFSDGLNGGFIVGALTGGFVVAIAGLKVRRSFSESHTVLILAGTSLAGLGLGYWIFKSASGH